MRIESVRVTCSSCEHTFDGEIVVEGTAAIWLASMRSLHCPECHSNEVTVQSTSGAKKS